MVRDFPLIANKVALLSPTEDLMAKMLLLLLLLLLMMMMMTTTKVYAYPRKNCSKITPALFSRTARRITTGNYRLKTKID